MKKIFSTSLTAFLLAFVVNQTNPAQTRNRVIDLDQSSESFEKLISEKKVIVDFYADWCGPCKRMHPIMDERAKKNSDITFIKVNIEKRRDIAQRYNIRSLPTFIFLKQGKIAKRVVGYKSPKEIDQEIKKIFG